MTSTANNRQDSNHSDLLVVGGGLVGASTALAFAQAGYQVTLVDRRKPQINKGTLGVDLRNVALSPASQALLAWLGVWQAVGAAPFQAMKVWEERGCESIAFNAQDVQRQELGWIVELSQVEVCLWTALAQANVHCVICESIESVTASETGTELVVSSGGNQTFTADLLIAADGANSVIRSLLAVPVTQQSVKHHALATVVKTAVPHGGCAYQNFLMGGPVALLPTYKADQVSVVWSQSPESAAACKALEADAFCAELTHATQACLGEILACDQRVVFPIQQQQTQQFNPRQRVVLIGDAARVLHPLAGFGVNVGLEDSRALLEACVGQIDLGGAGQLRVFARRRQARARLMIQLMSFFQFTYGLSTPSSQWVRNAWVKIVDNSQTVKTQLIREAMGLGALSRNF